MISLIIAPKKEAETDTIKGTLAKIKEYLRGMPDATIRITIEPRKGKGEKDASS